MLNWLKHFYCNDEAHIKNVERLEAKITRLEKFLKNSERSRRVWVEIAEQNEARRKKLWRLYRSKQQKWQKLYSQYQSKRDQLRNLKNGA